MKAEICPRCGGSLVRRTNKHTGEVFWGCSNFPNCRYSRSMHSAMREEYKLTDTQINNESAPEPVREEHKPRQFYYVLAVRHGAACAGRNSIAEPYPIRAGAHTPARVGFLFWRHR